MNNTLYDIYKSQGKALPKTAEERFADPAFAEKKYSKYNGRYKQRNAALYQKYKDNPDFQEKRKQNREKYRKSLQGKEKEAQYRIAYFSKPEVIEKTKLTQKAYRQKPEVKERLKANLKEYRLKTLYNLTLEDLQKMKEEQHYKCLICGIITELVVDHCHTNGHVRGLLCSSCNGGIGFLKDDIGILESAINYLKLTRK